MAGCEGEHCPEVWTYAVDLEVVVCPLACAFFWVGYLYVWPSASVRPLHFSSKPVSTP